MLPNTFEKYFNSTATTHCYETRNAFKKNHFLPQIRTNQGKNSLQFADVQIWNSIQLEWKNLSFSCFKRKIKQMLITKYSPNNTNYNWKQTLSVHVHQFFLIIFYMLSILDVWKFPMSFGWVTVLNQFRYEYFVHSNLSCMHDNDQQVGYLN